jgi:hypothetical protein
MVDLIRYTLREYGDGTWYVYDLQERRTADTTPQCFQTMGEAHLTRQAMECDYRLSVSKDA